MVVSPLIPFVIMSGIRWMVRIFVNAVAHPIITMVVPVVEQDAAIGSKIFLIFSSLWMNVPHINAYTAATAAASVGVKIPA